MQIRKFGIATAMLIAQLLAGPAKADQPVVVEKGKIATLTCDSGYKFGTSVVSGRTLTLNCVSNDGNRSYSKKTATCRLGNFQNPPTEDKNNNSVKATCQ
jgi:hypothetical protein